jgi:5'-nucleotidase
MLKLPCFLALIAACGFPRPAQIPDASDPTSTVDADAADAADAAAPSIGELSTRLLPPLNPPIPEQAAGESSMGDVVADSQLAATRALEDGGAVIAFTNPGGVKAGLEVGPVTLAAAMHVQPFGNSLVTMTLTGAQIEQLLEQQWESGVPRILQPSEGFSYTYKISAITDHVDLASMTLGGIHIDMVGQYRVTVNSFMSTGGDGFTVLTSGTDRVTGGTDLDALVAYLGAHRPLAAPTEARISTTP